MVDLKDDGEIGDRRRLASGKRPAGASWGASPAASSSWRRKTDLQASFRRIPPAAAKEDEEEDGGAKKSGRPDPHVRVILNFAALPLMICDACALVN